MKKCNSLRVKIDNDFMHLEYVKIHHIEIKNFKKNSLEQPVLRIIHKFQYLASECKKTNIK